MKGGSAVLMCCHPDPTAFTASDKAAYIDAFNLSNSALRLAEDSTRENTCSIQNISNE